MKFMSLILPRTRSFLFGLAFLVTVFGSNLAQASTCDAQFQKAERTIEEIYRDIAWSTYRYGECHQNVLRLLKKFEAEGLPVDQMQIVVLTGYNGMLRNPRGGGWYFHAVLKWGNTIFDYDSSRRPISVAEFKNQWHPFFEQPMIKALVVPAAAYRATSASLTGDANNGQLINSIVRALPMTPTMNLFMLGSF